MKPPLLTKLLITIRVAFWFDALQQPLVDAGVVGAQLLCIETKSIDYERAAWLAGEVATIAIRAN